MKLKKNKHVVKLASGQDGISGVGIFSGRNWNETSLVFGLAAEKAWNVPESSEKSTVTEQIC